MTEKLKWLYTITPVAGKICLKPLLQITSSSCTSTVFMGQLSHAYDRRGRRYVFLNLSNIILFTCCRVTDLKLLKHPKYLPLAALKSILQLTPQSQIFYLGAASSKGFNFLSKRSFRTSIAFKRYTVRWLLARLNKKCHAHVSP